jgi:hypothetical protein
MTDFTTDIELGKRYKDGQTGIEGTATSVHFYQYACERVAIEAVIEGKIEEYYFDAPRLTCMDTDEQVTMQPGKTGGPQRSVPSRSPRSR